MPTLSITELHHADAGQATEVAVTHLSSDRVVTAVRAGDGDLKVIAWAIAADGTVTREGDSTAGAVSRVSMTDWPSHGVVTAVVNGSGLLEVIAWTVDAAGVVVRKGSATGAHASAVTVSSPDGFAGVVTQTINSAGNLEVTSWTIDGQGQVTKKSTAAAGTAALLAVTALTKAASLARIAVGVKNGSGNLELITWGVTSTGTLSRIGRADAGPITALALTSRFNGNAELFSVTTGSSGDVTTIGWTVADDGTMTRFTTAHGGHATSPAVTTFHPDIHVYAIGACRTESGTLKLIAWRNGLDLTRHGELTSAAITNVAITNWSLGVVTATTGADGMLRLTSWKLRPTGVPLLHQEWPLVAPAPAMKAPHGKSATHAAPAPSTTSAHVSKYVPQSPGGPGGPPPGGPPPGPDGSGGNSPAFSHVYYPSVSGVDPMLAVGHDFVIVTQDHQVAFLDKSATPLVDGNGATLNFSATTFFHGFINAQNPDGSVNQNNINLISTTTTISEFYDTRVAYDAVAKRFVILSAARQPSTSVVRFFAFAASKTQDPRDGFHQYMTTESNYRDFPRLVVHNGMILQGHNAAGSAAEGETPVLYAFDMASAGQGLAEVPNWEYYPSDLNGAVRVFPVQHIGDTGGLTSAVDLRSGDGHLYLSAFPASADPWLAPKPIFAAPLLASEAPSPGPFMVFRDSMLQLAGAVKIQDRVPNVQPQFDLVRVIRVPFTQFSSAGLTVDTAHVVDITMGGLASTDAPTDLVSYDKAHIAVNVHGDALIAYGRTGVNAPALYPEVRYSVWKHGESGPRASALLQAGAYMPMQTLSPDTTPTFETQAYSLDYATAVVNPADDTTVWFINEYAFANADGSGKTWRTVVGVVNPSS